MESDGAYRGQMDTNRGQKRSTEASHSAMYYKNQGSDAGWQPTVGDQRLHKAAVIE
jgi:hypothetical protein